MCEADAFAREPVDIRRRHELAAIAAEIAVAEVVGKNEDDVRLWRFPVSGAADSGEEECEEERETGYHAEGFSGIELRRAYPIPPPPVS